MNTGAEICGRELKIRFCVSYVEAPMQVEGSKMERENLER